MTSNLIFDFDGTLVDSGPSILETLSASLRAAGLYPVRPITREIIGPPLMETLQTLTGSTDAVLLAALAADFRARYDGEGVFATEMYPGTTEALQALTASGKHLFLATNKRLRPTRLLLDHFRWTPWFDAVYCTDSRTPSFAHKGEMLLTLLHDVNVAVTDCLYVGDTRHDQQAAAYAGIRFVAVGWGYGVGEQACSVEVPVLTHPRDLLDLEKR